VPQLRRLVAGFPQPRPGFQPRSSHVGFVVDKVALEQVISEYFGFPCQFSFHRLLHIHHHLPPGAGTIDQLVAYIPSGLSLTPSQEIKTKNLLYRAIGLILDSIHRLVCGTQKTTTFRRLDLSPSSGGWGRINLLSWAR
jgi:hypothetical protein